MADYPESETPVDEAAVDPLDLGALIGAERTEVQAHHEQAAAAYGAAGGDFGALADEIQGDQPRTIQTRAALAGLLRAVGEGAVDLPDHRESVPVHVDRESAARAAGAWETHKWTEAAPLLASDSAKEIGALWKQAQRNGADMAPEDQQRLADFLTSFASGSQGVLKPGGAAAGLKLAEVDAVTGGARLVFHAPDTVPPAVAANVSDTAIVEPSKDTTPSVVRDPDGTLGFRAEPTPAVKEKVSALRPVGVHLNPGKAVQWVPAQPRSVDWVDSVVDSVIADAGDRPVSMTVRLAPAQPIRAGNRLVVDIDASNPRLAEVIEESVGKPATTEKGGVRHDRVQDEYQQRGVATVVFDLGEKATRADVTTAWGLALAAAQDVQAEVSLSAYLAEPGLAPPGAARVAEHHFVDKTGRCLAVRSGDDDVANENMTYAWVPKDEAAKLGPTQAQQLRSRRTRVIGRETNGEMIVDNEVRLVTPEGDVRILESNVLASTVDGKRLRHAAVYLPPGQMPTVVLAASAEDVAASDGRVVMVHLGTTATLEVPEVNGNPDTRLAYEADAVLRRLGAKLPPGRVTIRAKAAE